MSTGRRAARVATVGTTGLIALALATTAALAQWTTTGAGTGSVTTTTITAPTAANAAGASATTVTVSVTAGPSSGAPVHGYRVDRTSPAPASGVCFITGTTGSCTAPASGTGTQTYSIVSYRGTTSLQYWQSAPLAGITGTPLTAPTVTVDKPTAGQSFANSGQMNNNCPSSQTGVCGTATAGSGTLGSGAVTLTLRRTVGSTVTFWNGSAWTSSSSTLTASGTTAWLYSIGYSTLRAGGASGTATYLVSVTVTDSSGSTASTTRTFTTT
jgi:hypothetical protein